MLKSFGKALVMYNELNEKKMKQSQGRILEERSGRSLPIKPTKVTAFTMNLYNPGKKHLRY